MKNWDSGKNLVFTNDSFKGLLLIKHIEIISFDIQIQFSDLELIIEYADQ